MDSRPDRKAAKQDDAFLSLNIMDLLDQLRNLQTVDELNTLIESKGVDYLYNGFGLRNCPLFLAFLMTMSAYNDQQFKKECIDTFFLHEVNLTLTHEEKDVGRIASVYGGDVRYYLYRRLAEKAYSHPMFLHNVLCLGMGSTYLNADILEILDLLLETNKQYINVSAPYNRQGVRPNFTVLEYCVHELRYQNIFASIIPKLVVAGADLSQAVCTQIPTVVLEGLRPWAQAHAPGVPLPEDLIGEVTSFLPNGPTVTAATILAELRRRSRCGRPTKRKRRGARPTKRKRTCRTRGRKK